MLNHLSDTDPIVEQKLINILRESSVSIKLSLTFNLCSITRQLSFRALERKNPGASEQEINIQFVKMNYGEILANKLRLHYSKSYHAEK